MMLRNVTKDDEAIMMIDTSTHDIRYVYVYIYRYIYWLFHVRYDTVVVIL